METYKDNIDHNKDRFCELIKLIFMHSGFTVNNDNNIDIQQELLNDFSMCKGLVSYYVFIRYFNFYNYRTNSLDVYLESIKDKIKCNDSFKKKDNKILIVTNGYYKNKDIISKNLDNQYIILDIENLLYLVSDEPGLKMQLLGNISFSVVRFEEKNPVQLNLFEDNIDQKIIKNITSTQKTGLELINKLSGIKHGKASSTKYEKVCLDILQFLFLDDLWKWKEQQYSNDDLYRFDLICRIKDTDISNFWKVLQDFFNSKYVIFEFKNYKDKITQKEVYTTERYLYSKALRSVAIIISRQGSSDNAVKAIKGTLRENGKLIISICDADIINMIKWKIDNRLPSDYLYELLDEMLIELEK